MTPSETCRKLFQIANRSNTIDKPTLEKYLLLLSPNIHTLSVKEICMTANAISRLSIDYHSHLPVKNVLKQIQKESTLRINQFNPHALSVLLSSLSVTQLPANSPLFRVISHRLAKLSDSKIVYNDRWSLCNIALSFISSGRKDPAVLEALSRLLLFSPNNYKNLTPKECATILRIFAKVNWHFKSTELHLLTHHMLERLNSYKPIDIAHGISSLALLKVNCPTLISAICQRIYPYSPILNNYYSASLSSLSLPNPPTSSLSDPLLPPGSPDIPLQEEKESEGFGMIQTSNIFGNSEAVESDSPDQGISKKDLRKIMYKERVVEAQRDAIDRIKHIISTQDMIMMIHGCSRVFGHSLHTELFGYESSSQLIDRILVCLSTNPQINLPPASYFLPKSTPSHDNECEELFALIHNELMENSILFKLVETLQMSSLPLVMESLKTIVPDGLLSLTTTMTDLASQFNRNLHSYSVSERQKKDSPLVVDSLNGDKHHRTWEKLGRNSSEVRTTVSLAIERFLYKYYYHFVFECCAKNIGKISNNLLLLKQHSTNSSHIAVLITNIKNLILLPSLVVPSSRLSFPSNPSTDDTSSPSDSSSPSNSLFPEALSLPLDSFFSALLIERALTDTVELIHKKALGRLIKDSHSITSPHHIMMLLTGFQHFESFHELSHSPFMEFKGCGNDWEGEKGTSSSVYIEEGKEGRERKVKNSYALLALPKKTRLVSSELVYHVLSNTETPFLGDSSTSYLSGGGGQSNSFSSHDYVTILTIVAKAKSLLELLSKHSLEYGEEMGGDRREEERRKGGKKKERETIFINNIYQIKSALQRNHFLYEELDVKGFVLLWRACVKLGWDEEIRHDVSWKAKIEKKAEQLISKERDGQWRLALQKILLALRVDSIGE